MASFFDDLRKTLGAKLRAATGRAMTRANDIVKAISGQQISGNQIMRDKKNLVAGGLQPKHVGRLCMYFYNPKWREKLPYYDRFPLVIPIELYEDGFLGLNLHYLPYEIRARVMDTLYDKVYSVSNPIDIDDNRLIRITYPIVKRLSDNKFFKPCVKRYLYSQFSSRIYMLDKGDWDVALYLPSERFVKQSKHAVWKDSTRKIREG